MARKKQEAQFKMVLRGIFSLSIVGTIFIVFICLQALWFGFLVQINSSAIIDLEDRARTTPAGWSEKRVQEYNELQTNRTEMANSGWPIQRFIASRDIHAGWRLAAVFFSFIVLILIILFWNSVYEINKKLEAQDQKQKKQQVSRY